MTYCENLTNRELVAMAMPFSGLSREQWRALMAHASKFGTEPVLGKALETVLANQAKLEIQSNYFDYYGEDYDNLIREPEVEDLRIA